MTFSIRIKVEYGQEGQILINQEINDLKKWFSFSFLSGAVPVKEVITKVMPQRKKLSTFQKDPFKYKCKKCCKIAVNFNNAVKVL